MARRGKPLGNKRQREQAKARKKREKEARRVARKGGAPDGEQEDVADAPIPGWDIPIESIDLKKKPAEGSGDAPAD
jgi:hypothetical protein